ncbi:MAG: hypothetical protein P4L98_12510 [Ancalomicrobiaceae bacterium]|nr:hypothetical protein [Ancalomicrobiaceae bacterium]
MKPASPFSIFKAAAHWLAHHLPQRRSIGHDMRLLRSAIVLSGLCAASAAFAAECSVPHFHFADNGITQAKMFTARGVPCAFYFMISESGLGDAGILDSTVKTRPSHGMLGHSSVRMYAYQPAEGFAGTDQFEIDVRYDRSGKTFVTTMHVQVIVSN